jgi:predicted CopG family antitoxin
MSRTLTIPDELYERLAAEAHARGLDSVERLLDELGRNGVDLHQRSATVSEIDSMRERLYARYGEMPDSVELVRADRAR